jgi:hypothetical protein
VHIIAYYSSCYFVAVGIIRWIVAAAHKVLEQLVPLGATSRDYLQPNKLKLVTLVLMIVICSVFFKKTSFPKQLTFMPCFVDLFIAFLRTLCHTV